MAEPPSDTFNFIYRIGMMLLTVLHFFVFILTNTTG